MSAPRPAGGAVCQGNSPPGPWSWTGPNAVLEGLLLQPVLRGTFGWDGNSKVPGGPARIHWTSVCHEQRFKDDDTIQTASNLEHVGLGGGGVPGSARLSGKRFPQELTVSCASCLRGRTSAV